MNEAKAGNLCYRLYQAIVTHGAGMFTWEIADKSQVPVADVHSRVNYLVNKGYLLKQRHAKGVVYHAVPGVEYIPTYDTLDSSYARRGQRRAQVLRALPSKRYTTVDQLVKLLKVGKNNIRSRLEDLVLTGEVEKLRISAYPKRYGYRRTAFAKEVAGVPRESLLDANEKIQYELFSSSDFYPAQYRPNLKVRDCREKARKARLKDA